MATGGDDRDRFEDDWFEEPAGEPAGGFRDPEAETWLEDEPEDGGGPGDRRPLIAAIAVAVVLVLAGIGIARIVGGDDDGEPAATAPGTTAPTATGGKVPRRPACARFYSPPQFANCSVYPHVAGRMRITLARSGGRLDSTGAAFSRPDLRALPTRTNRRHMPTHSHSTRPTTRDEAHAPEPDRRQHVDP